MYKLLKALRFFLYPLYLFSYFIPRDKNIWLFGAHQNRYAENSKALFIYCSLHVNDIKPIWISGDKVLCEALHVEGFRAYYRWGFKGIYYSLKAQYYFYNVYSDDINFYTSANATLINLWHGIALKHIEFDIKKGPLSCMFNSKLSGVYAFFKPYIFRNPDYLLSPSSKVSKTLASAFRIKASQCLELGFPRCDVLFKEEVRNEEKVILYMPTWRSYKEDFFSEAMPDLEKLNAVLIESDVKMQIKLHPNSFVKKQNFSHILFLDEKSDVYDVLAQSDYLITDYSSIYFDYLLLDKEIIFYAFDYDEYMSEDREMYYCFDEVTPGEKVYDFESLLDTIKKLSSLEYSSERKKIRDEFWLYQDASASKRICTYVKENL